MANSENTQELLRRKTVMRIRRKVAELLSLILVFTTVFSNNLLLVSADSTPGKISVSIEGSGEIQFEFFEDASGNTVCASGGNIQITSSGDVDIPSSAASVKIKAWGTSGYSGSGVTGDFQNNDIFGQDGKLYSISSSSGYLMSVSFTANEGGEGDPPAGNTGDIKINVNNLSGSSVVSYKIGDGSWTDFTSGMTLGKANELSGVSNGTMIYFKATPDVNQIIDTHANQNWINIDGQQTDLNSADLKAGTVGIAYDSTKAYELQIKFDGNAGPGGEGGEGGGESNPPEGTLKDVNLTVSWSGSFGDIVVGGSHVSLEGTSQTFTRLNVSDNDIIVSLYAEPTREFTSIKIDGVEKLGEGETKGDYSFSISDSATTLSIVALVQQTGEYTIQWAYDESFGMDAMVEHGTVEMKGGCTSGEGTYWLAKEGDTVSVYLVPDYGYQVVGAEINGNALTAGEAQNEFSFVMPSTNVHFRGIFTKTDDIVANSSAAVSEASFDGSKVATSGGTAKMTIATATPASTDSIAEASIDSSKTVLAVDISMNQLFYKNTASEVWSSNKTELESSASVSLKVSQDAASYAVIRTHGDSVEEIPAAYNSETKTITFSSDKYSTYTLVPLNDSNSVSITDANKGSYYSADSEGAMVCVINDGSGTKVFDSILVPADYHFIVENTTVVANSITVEAGGYLEILGTGSLTVTTLNATAVTDSTPGSYLMLNKNTNRPSCVSVLFDITEGAVDITDDSKWSEFLFEYISDENITGWCTHTSPSCEYAVFIEGYEDGCSQVKVSFSSDSRVSYSTPVNVEVEEENSMTIGRINEVPESTTNVKISVTINGGSHKKIYYAFSGNPGDEKEIQDNKYGELSYEIEFNHSLNEEDSGYIPHEVHVILANEKEGTSATKNLINNELYAYSDLNGDSSVDATDMKLGLATELCARFFWDKGGIIDDGVFDIYKPLDLYDPSDEATSRILISDAGSITAKDADYNDTSIKRYRYTINLRKNNLESDVIAEGYVYGLTGYNQILVYTGTGFFIRSTSDEVTFYSDSNHPENNDTAIGIKSSFKSSNVRIGGNGSSQGSEAINPEGDEVYCVNIANKMSQGSPLPNGGWFVDYFNRYYTSYTSLNGYSGCNKVRIINPAQTYVIVNTEGESKNVYGINSEQVDRVSQTGTGKQTDVFIGNNAVHIEAVSSDIAAVASIKSVKLKDNSMADGVVISKVADDDFKVEFKSNFYDSVPLIITYGNDVEKELTINRIGLVVQSMYLDDNANTFRFYHGGEQGSASCSYNYRAGQTVIVYATYYHPSSDVTGGSSNLSLFVTNDDGTTQIINKTAYTPATTDSVAMTDFVIAFRQGREIFEDGNFGSNIDPSMQGMHAIVLNNGFDDNTTFSGTQIGSGKGVYWNGRIEWNY